jgi:Ca2+-transporting ATPase
MNTRFMPLDFDAAIANGLTELEASARLARHGPNELPSRRQRGILATAWDVVREPMFLLLLACGMIYLALGDVREACMLLAFVFVVLGITFIQERKTERALEALRDLSSPRALVVRDGAQRRIAGRDVVPGDILVLAEGDRVAADAALLSCNTLKTDESLLTGESVPVQKVAWDGITKSARPGGDDLPFVYAGSLVVQGQAVAEVLATGSRTEMGAIGTALQAIDVENTRLQMEVSQLVQRVAVAGLMLCTIVVALYGVTYGDWIKGLLAGITLAMAMVPEEFPVVLTIFLALGAWRLSRVNVLTRRVPVIETLGAATVLCVDKTGTLTANRMSIRRLAVNGNSFNVEEYASRELPEDFHALVEFGILASQRDPFDPMERAFHELGNRQLAHTEHLHADWTLEREYPLSPALLAMSHVWKSRSGQDYILAAKGAPEAIAELCHLDIAHHARLTAAVEQMAADGLRVLGVARGTFRERTLPKEQHDLSFEFLGLVGLADPLRSTAAAAIDECRTAGIRVVMITGDHPSTARNIARRAGLRNCDEIVTGSELAVMDELTLRQRAAVVDIFARMVPEQKLRLVNALKANGEIVAMTGDGVNDAPALKAAHIGIAMGGRGTDVAREASSLVLLDDDFASIVRSVRMGRRIFDHLQKAMTYIVAAHVPIAGMSLIPVAFGWPQALLPVHILFIELLIDPACSIVFEAEPEESDVMRRPPRPPASRLFGPELIGFGVLQGVGILVIVLGVYLLGLRGWKSDADAVALSFATLVMANLGLIVANRSWAHTSWSLVRPATPAFRWVLVGTVIGLGLVLYVPPLRHAFHFSTLHLLDLALCASGGLLSLLWCEGLKVSTARATGHDRSSDGL